MKKRSRWRLAVVLVVLCGASWLLPGSKPSAVFGRLNYLQFYLASALTVLAVSGLAVLALPERWRRFVGFRLAAVGFSFLTVVLALEGLAWLMPVRSPLDNPWFLAPELGGVAESTRLPYARPPHFSWTGMSHGDLAIRNHDDDPHARVVTFKTDWEGFRNSRDLTQADIVAIGDSYTEAGNVGEEDTFPFRVGQKLGLTVRNLGRAGYTTPTEWIVLQEHGLKCQPKVVIWQVTETNDLSDVDDYERWIRLGRPNYLDFSNRGKPTRSQAWRRRSLTWRLFDRLRVRDLNAWPFSGYFKTADAREELIRFLPPPGLGSPARGHPAWAGFTRPLVEAAQLCRSNGIQLLVVHLPDKFRVMGPHTRFPPAIAAESAAFPGLPREVSMGVVLREFCESHQIDYLDAFDSLQPPAAAGQLVYQLFDTHLSPLGNDIVADRIAEALAKGRGKPPE